MVIRRESRQHAINRLKADIQRFERRYECRSDKMVAKVKANDMKETAEVAKWMITYERLKALEAR